VFLWGNAALTAILTPKRVDYGATLRLYRQERRGVLDAAFLGSSMAYCDVVPALLWEASGIASYVVSGPNQPMAVTECYMRQMYRTQSPRAVFVEASGLFFPMEDDFTEVNIGYMPWGLDRVAATFRASSPSKWASLLFPLYRYHARWGELTAQDYEIGVNGYGRDPLAGYTFLNDFRAQAGVTRDRARAFAPSPAAGAGPAGEGVADGEGAAAGEGAPAAAAGAVATEAEYRKHFAALLRMIALAERRGSSLVLYLAPCTDQLAPERVGALLADLAAAGHVGAFPASGVAAADGAAPQGSAPAPAGYAGFVDMNDYMGEMGLDLARDFFDRLHLNHAGAEKHTAWLAGFLSEGYPGLAGAHLPEAGETGGDGAGGGASPAPGAEGAGGDGAGGARKGAAAAAADEAEWRGRLEYYEGLRAGFPELTDRT
jgi:hypothetical protein